MIPAILYYFVKKMSIKTVKFLRYFISQNQKLPSALAGKVAALSQKAHSEPQQYIKGFFEAVQKHSAKDSGLVVRLFDRVQEYMVTNMAKDQYLKVAMDVVGSGKLSDEDFYTVPGEGVVTPRYDEFYADKEALTPILLELFYREIE